MSFEAVAIVLNHSRARGTEKLVLLGIANHQGDGGAWPAISTLARYANVSERAVQKSITRLIELGELSRDIKGGGTARTPDHVRTNRFEVTLCCPETCDRTAAHKVSEPVDNPPSEPVDKGGEPQFTRCPPGQGGGELQDRGVVNHSSPQELSINYQLTTSPQVPTSPERECVDCGQRRPEDQITGGGVCFNCLPSPPGARPDIGSGYQHWQNTKKQLWGGRPAHAR